MAGPNTAALQRQLAEKEDIITRLRHSGRVHAAELVQMGEATAKQLSDAKKEGYMVLAEHTKKVLGAAGAGLVLGTQALRVFGTDFGMIVNGALGLLGTWMIWRGLKRKRWQTVVWGAFLFGFGLAGLVQWLEETDLFPTDVVENWGADVSAWWAEMQAEQAAEAAAANAGG